MAATLSFRHHYPLNEQHCGSVNMDQDIGSVQLVPDFVFPPRSSGDQPTNTRRPASMNLAPSSHYVRNRATRQSASALPTFSFNASDTTGLVQNSGEPSPTGLTIPVSPSKSTGHRRGASELVGGDSRRGIGGVMGSSPSKHLDSLPVPDGNGSPSRRRGHAHRRSTAISSHDLNSILQPRDANMQSSLGSPPQTPTDSTMLSHSSPAKSMSEGLSPDNSLVTPSISVEAEETTIRPPSRLRVGFSENVEYIPRPLSTVSSETASSASTARGHRVASSMSSLISLGGIGSPSPRRTRMSSPSSNLDVSPRSMPSVEPYSAEIATEGPETQRPLTEFALSENTLPVTSGTSVDVLRFSKKKNFLKLDRRRSEPLISLTASNEIGTSTISLQEPLSSADADSPLDLSETTVQGLHRESSRKRVKKWATSILGRKPRDSKKAKSLVGSDEATTADNQTSEAEQQPMDESEEEEPDLDAMFGQDPFTDDGDDATCSIASPRTGMSDSFMPFFASSRSGAEDTSPVIDLDAALGPYGTPSMSWDALRPVPKKRQLHSSRLNKDFVGPGMHYHRRTESAPALVPFEFCGRASSPGQSPMDDVFEEEEDEAATDETNEADEEIGTGIQVVDAANEQYEPNFDWTFEDDLGVERNSSGRTTHSFGLVPPLSTSEGRRTSVVEDTIPEESGPLEIVAEDEEPRMSTVTKSSDSSDARTVSGESSLILPPSQPQSIPLTPTSNVVSTFSSPDFSQNQGSFDVLRLGTSASSIADNRTMSSYTTAEPTTELYMSADDVPSLTSSRSTMISTMYQTSPRRDIPERPVSMACASGEAELQASERRRKRSSIQSLSKLMGGPFGESKTKLGMEQRPHTAVSPSVHDESKRKKEHRLSRLMFWRSKSDSRSLFQSK